MSWGMDETASFYDNENFTLQWCLMSEGILTRRYLGLWGGKGASFHHNLIANCSGRSPRFVGSRYSGRPDLELVDFRNNVIYNWGSNTGTGGEGGRYNMVNNYYQPGPESANPTRIMQPQTDGPTGPWATFYVAGNHMRNRDGTPNTAINNDNWIAVIPDPSTKNKDEIKSLEEYDKGNVTTHTALEAYELILESVGASFRRDPTDTRVVNEVRNRLAPRRAPTNVPIGLINSQRDVGGWDTYTFNTEDVPVDSDGDGMPDEWEIAYGLDPNDPTDGVKTNLSGGTYTNLEVYLYDILRRNKK